MQSKFYLPFSFSVRRNDSFHALLTIRLGPILKTTRTVFKVSLMAVRAYLSSRLYVVMETLVETAKEACRLLFLVFFVLFDLSLLKF